MKKSRMQSVICQLSMALIFLCIASALIGQEPQKASLPLPDNVKTIVAKSCMPCHSSTGGLMSRSKLNFDEWTSYSADKQKDKANDMYSKISKDKMPPKNARETRPEIIPTKEQVRIIKKWADSF